MTTGWLGLPVLVAGRDAIDLVGVAVSLSGSYVEVEYPAGRALVLPHELRHAPRTRGPVPDRAERSELPARELVEGAL